jgi:hypothetical protein
VRSCHCTWQSSQIYACVYNLQQLINEMARTESVFEAFADDEFNPLMWGSFELVTN